MNDNIKIDEKGKFFKFLSLLVLVLAFFLAIQSVNAIRSYRYIGSDRSEQNAITVSGKGEVFAVPDIATFSFSVIEEAKTVEEAQRKSADKMNATLLALEGREIEEKDIRTEGYNVNPKYEYSRSMCNDRGCNPSAQTLIGYEVNQNVSIKVRDAEKAGEVLGVVGGAGASNISGISFTIDDEEALKRDARKLAIEDAQSKAKELSRDLGVKIVRIVSFNESEMYPPVMYYKGLENAVMQQDSAVNVSVPLGENKMESHVSITYEIR